MGRPTLSAHRKFRRLAAALGSRPLARGLLEQLWDTAYEAGDDYIGDSTDLEAAAGWDREPGLLTKALLEAGGAGHGGFVEDVPGKPGHYRVHDFWHHVPDYVRKRRQREEERRQKSDPVGTTGAIQQSLTGRLSPHGGQQVPNPDCSEGVAFPPAPAPALSPALPLPSEETKMTPEGSDGANEPCSDDLIGKICNAHPRLSKPLLTEQYVVNAAQEEIARGRSNREALEYLLERTRLYREMTAQWPQDQLRYVLSSHEFYRTGEYRTDPKFWNKANDAGERRQNPLPPPPPVPASETIKKQLEAERQTAQTRNEGYTA